MKLSEAWLREYVNPKIDSEQLQSQLSLAGLEVDGVEPVAAHFSKVVVGQVLTKTKHPNADKLSICDVDIGTEKLQIVCGAKNVAAGMKVPVAIVGAVLPGDFKIKKSRLRDIDSHGMICSTSELGLAEQSDGILPLPQDAPVGNDFRDYWQLNDVSIDIDLTPNRADCLSVIGIAREIGVANQCKVALPKIPAVKETITDQHHAIVEAEKQCPRYLTRVVKGIDNTRKTPWHIIEKLRRSGIRSINPIVDVTNYVMLLLGQPLHAFDHNALKGDIVVRLAKANETITLLGGQTLSLQDKTLLITDTNGPLAMAGIMGGEHSGVTDKTTDIVLESAFFTPHDIAGCARQYGLHTDSSHRFERGVDPRITQDAIQLATNMILEFTGGEVGPVLEVKAEQYIPDHQTVTLRISRVERLLGLAVSAKRIKTILQHLGLTLETEKEDQQIWLIPSFRFDIAIEADLIEEIARIEGYDAIVSTAPTLPMTTFSVSEKQISVNQLKSHLIQQGFYEALTYSFIDPRKQVHFTNGIEPYQLHNPISSDMATMRVSLMPGLLDAVSYNLKRQQSRVRLFEIGRCFLPDSKGVHEPMHVAGVICGTVSSEHWQGNRQADFFAIKGIVESLLQQTGHHDEFSFEPLIDSSWLHPGQAAKIIRNKQLIGVVGALHPEVKKAFKLKQDIFVFELNYHQLQDKDLPTYHAISKYPSIRRDIAIEVDQGLAAQRALDIISSSAGEYLQHTGIFDVYQGERVEKDKKSLAIYLIFQAISHTLTEEEVNKAMDRVVAGLEKNIHAQLRE